MKVIGITGGVGSGKTKLLQYIGKRYRCRVYLADEAARRLQEPGGACYGRIAALLGEEALEADGTISRMKMAERVFADRTVLEAVNRIVHPAVRDEILREIEAERRAGKCDFFFLEAALLIECGYESVVDEMWYIYAGERTRRVRLRTNRGYDDGKIDGILRSQLPEETYREHCGVVIDNDGAIERAYEQIDRKMGEYLWKR